MNEPEYDCSLAAALLIVDMIQTNPHVTTPELVSFCVYTILEAIYKSGMEAGARNRTARRELMEGKAQDPAYPSGGHEDGSPFRQHHRGHSHGQ